MRRLHSGSAIDRQETINLTLQTIPGVVWLQPRETRSTNIHKIPTTENPKKNHMSEFKQRNDVEAQSSPMKETSPRVSGSSTGPFLEKQTRSTPVQSLKDCKKRQSEIQRHEMNMTANDNGNENIPRPKITTSQTEERLVRDDTTNELYMPLSSTIVLKRKKEVLYVPLDFENGLTIDAPVDSGAYVSAIAQSELDRIQQQASASIFKIDDSPNFQVQVANGQLGKPMATATLKFVIGDNNFAEHFVKMNLTGPIKGLHFMRHNTVVIDTRHGFIQFPHLTLQAKNAAIETSVKPQAVLIHHSTTVPPWTTKTIAAFVDLPTEWHKTGAVIPVGMFTEAASLLISHSISTISDKKTAVRITSIAKLADLIKKNKQNPEFSVVTPEQSKLLRPVDTAILNIIPEGDLDLTTYSGEIIKTNKPEQQNNNFWFPTSETEEHTPIQTRILKERQRELQEKRKLNSKDEVESRKKEICKNDLIGQTHCLWKSRNMQREIF